jgi:cytidyltransferase-like protein
VVYIGGTWDLLHAGHLSVLEKAKVSGDYLIVGVYSNSLASVLHARSKEGNGEGASSRSSSGWQRGEGEALYDHTYPILSMEERMLSILGCKYVDDVLLDAPYVPSGDLLSSLRISIVLTECAGSDDGIAAQKSDVPSQENGKVMVMKEKEVEDHNRVPKDMNILRSVAPSFSITGGIHTDLSFHPYQSYIANSEIFSSTTLNCRRRDHGSDSEARRKIQEKVSSFHS